MRIHRHDVRDMSLAFGLAFDLRRVSQAGFALCWTLVVLLGVTAILSWRTSAGMLTPEGIYVAALSLGAARMEPLQLLLIGLMVAGWWVGFGYLCAPVLRGVALDIARDERRRATDIPLLNRQAAFAPLMVMLAPLLALILLLLWSLLTYIPGVAGALIAGVTLPPILLLAVGASAFLLTGLLAAPMMGPTAAVEGRDYLETVSRPMSYVLQQPGRYFAYWAAKLGVMAGSALAGALALALAWILAGGALWLTGQGGLALDAASQAMADPEVTGTSDMAMAIAVVFWASMFALVAWLMVVGLACDMIIYLLMRYRVDGVTYDKIAMADDHAPGKSAVDTAAEAEQARVRFDEQQARAEEPAAP
jgi:hypothetical protein